MLNSVRSHDSVPEEIYSKKNWMSDDTLTKVLFEDIVHQSRGPARLSLVNAENCYDQIVHAIASLVFQLYGVPGPAAKAMLEMIQEMKFFLWTAVIWLMMQGHQLRSKHKVFVKGMGQPQQGGRGSASQSFTCINGRDMELGLSV